MHKSSLSLHFRNRRIEPPAAEVQEVEQQGNLLTWPLVQRPRMSDYAKVMVLCAALVASVFLRPTEAMGASQAARISLENNLIQLVQACGWYAIFGCDADNPHVDGPGHTIWTSDYSSFRPGYYCNVLGPSSHGVAVRNAHIYGGYAKSACWNQKRGDDEEARAITLVRAKAPSVKYVMRKGVKVIFEDIKRKDECLYELEAREDHPEHTVHINTYEADICNNTIKAMD